MSDNTLYIVNSLTRQKEAFTPSTPGYVGMYVCGPTVYSDVHLGNCRTFVSFDIMYRYLGAARANGSSTEVCQWLPSDDGGIQYSQT